MRNMIKRIITCVAVAANPGIVFVASIATAAPCSRITNLTANDGETGDEFGFSVAISGSTAVVGAPKDDDLGPNSGSAYVFNVADRTQIAKLIPEDGQPGDWFGWSVAISGNMAVVGAYLDKNEHAALAGSAYVFDITTGRQLAKFAPVDGMTASDFGWSVAIDGEHVVVGAPAEHGAGQSSGAAYVYDLSTGERVARLAASDGAENEYFGQSVAITGNIVIVSAPGDGEASGDAGSAYFFDATSGRQLARRPLNNANWSGVLGDASTFNKKASIVGTLGFDLHVDYAYLFEMISANQIAGLLAMTDDSNVEPDVRAPEASAEETGSATYAVAVSGTTAVIGVTDAGELQPMCGAVYIFDAGCGAGCLTLNVAPLVAGKNADIRITNGVPGTRALTVYGFQPGQTRLENSSGYCATFGIRSVKRQNVLGGFRHRFNDDGEISFSVRIPADLHGMSIYIQASQQDTCPDECMSNVLEMIVQ